MMIELDPEIAAIYRASNAVSGKYHSDFYRINICLTFQFLTFSQSGYSGQGLIVKSHEGNGKEKTRQGRNQGPAKSWGSEAEGDRQEIGKDQLNGAADARHGAESTESG